jgi:hypothetical protein
VGIHTPPHRSGILAFSIIIVSFRSQNILDLLQTNSLGNSGRRHPTVAMLLSALEMGRLRTRCKLGFDLNTQVHHCRDEPGIVRAAIYGAILIDQHSLRSHPNQAVDVVVCQSFWIDSGSRFINFGPAVLAHAASDSLRAHTPVLCFHAILLRKLAGEGSDRRFLLGRERYETKNVARELKQHL